MTRAKLRRGRLQRLAAEERPRRSAWLPVNVLLRALALALVVTVTLVPIVLAVLAILLPDHISFGLTWLLNALYFALLAIVVMPLVLWRALRDPAPPSPSPA